MLTKNDFTSTDWKMLRDLPHWVGFGVLMAGSSGLGTVKESMALAQGIVEGQSSDVPLIRDITNRAEMEGAQQSIKDAISGQDASGYKNLLRKLTMDRVGLALLMLRAKGSPEEVSAFSQLLYNVADKVANAAKEGGFLGFGGVRVSEEEQTFLNELKTALA